jgi:hypothetical protein
MVAVGRLVWLFIHLVPHNSHPAEFGIFKVTSNFFMAFCFIGGDKVKSAAFDSRRVSSSGVTSPHPISQMENPK